MPLSPVPITPVLSSPSQSAIIPDHDRSPEAMSTEPSSSEVLSPPPPPAVTITAAATTRVMGENRRQHRHALLSARVQQYHFNHHQHNHQANNAYPDASAAQISALMGRSMRSVNAMSGPWNTMNFRGGHSASTGSAGVQQVPSTNHLVPGNHPTHHASTARLPTPPSIHPQFKSKAVCKLYCKYCTAPVCNRGMKAILLGNTKVELYSTDHPPAGLGLVFHDYQTSNCFCKIKDAACLSCGNIVGYNVTSPCEKCLESCHNGHMWMFLADGISSEERRDPMQGKCLKWATIPPVEMDYNLDISQGSAVR